MNYRSIIHAFILIGYKIQECKYREYYIFSVFNREVLPMLIMKRITIIINRKIEIKQLFIFPLAFLLGCQPKLINDSDTLNTAQKYSAEQTDKLFVVDCLLPGQVRKLGKMTYLTARRPIKTTAGECEVRGGEYVAYDRADYASSLKVWLPQAKEGDVNAQVILGEMYEKGLGGMADPVLAGQWYRKAAAQGNSRAQINLGHLYEKGLGVEQNLPEALNWYRKASGLDNTDLEFASVTQAAVAEGYEKQLGDLRRASEVYQQQADALRQQLGLARHSYLEQQRKLTSLESQLEQTRKTLQQEKNKKDVDQQLIQQLEKKLRSNQSSLSQQKSKLANIQLEVEKESQASIFSYHEQLKNQQQLLQLKESKFQDVLVNIKRGMEQIDDKTSVAASTQEKLVVESLREALQAEKTELSTIGRQIKQLKNSIADNKIIIANLETQEGKNLLLSHAGIEMIVPAMVLTRGIPSYQLRSINRSKKIIGKVYKVKDLQSLTVNGLVVSVDQEGVFQTLVDIKADLNPVEIIANYKGGSPSQLSFNLLAKISDPELIAQHSPSLTSTTYASVDFGRFYALVIGNQDYALLPDLKTSVNDARAVEEVLRLRYGYKTTLLVNANRHQVMTAFNDLRKILSEKDNLLIYYAGHGEIDKSDQSAYWLPTDAELDNSANWLSSHSITQYLNIMAAKHILVVADSCYSGAMTQSAVVRLPGKMPEEKRKKWLEFMVNRKARTVMTSGGVKPVLDAGGGQHSIFAQAFLRVLKQNNGLLEDYELFREVSGSVQKSASFVGFQQSPQYSAMVHAGHEGSPFFFVANVK